MAERTIDIIVHGDAQTTRTVLDSEWRVGGFISADGAFADSRLEILEDVPGVLETSTAQAIGAMYPVTDPAEVVEYEPGHEVGNDSLPTGISAPNNSVDSVSIIEVDPGIWP